MTLEPDGATDDATDVSTNFRRELLDRVHAVDLFVLCAVPIAMCVVFILPESTRRSLAFAYDDPTLVTAFTAHYVHLSAGHLVGNVAGYGLLASVGYALAVLGGRRRFFVTALTTFLLAFPFVLSGLNLAVPRDALGFGFSGINMALTGLLPVLLWGYARDRFVPTVSPRALPAAFFPLVGWIAFLALPVSTRGVGLAGVATAISGVLIGLVYANTVGIRLRQPIRARIRTVAGRAGYGDLFVIGVVLLVGYPVIGFPADLVGGGSVVNIYVHLLGFCLAFIAAFVVLVVDVIGE